MATLNFDATTVAPQEPRTLIPTGDYNAQIVKSEIKPTRDGQSQYLALELEILDGEHKGRHLFDNLNLWNANETAARIAQQTLSAIGHAVGILQIADSEILHNRPLRIAVKVEKGTPAYPDDKNVVKGYGAYKAAGAAPAAAPTFAPVPPPVQQFAPPPVQAAPAAPVAPVAPPNFPGMAPAVAAPQAPAAPVAAPSAPPPFPPVAGGLPQWAQAQG